MTAYRQHPSLCCSIGLGFALLLALPRAVPASAASAASAAGTLEQPGWSPAELILLVLLLAVSSLLVFTLRQRKQHRQQLAHLEELLSSMIDSMPALIIGADAEGRVLQWNRQAKEFIKLPEAEAQGALLNRVFPQLPIEPERIRRVIKEGEPHREPKLPHRENGEVRYFDVTISPWLARETQGAVIRLEEVTERVLMEEMMIQSEKMMSISGLAIGMVHEINNPLASILQNMQVIHNRLSGKLQKNRLAAENCGTSMERIEAYLNQRGINTAVDAVREAARRAAKVIANMLNFSREGDLVLALHSLSDLLDKAVDLAANDYDLKQHYDFRQVEIERQYDPTLPPVPCSSVKLQQAFLNILKNRAKAMMDSPAPQTAHRLVLRLQRDGDLARIEIEDNGPSMPESTRRNLFKPFAAGEGGDLGLCVSYFIISNNHGGTMGIDPAPERGTRFVIRLPLEREHHG